MAIYDFLEKYWNVISGNPLFFVSNSILFSTLGFLGARLMYGAVATIAKERLEAARDDLARLEKAKRDESATVAELREKISELTHPKDPTPAARITTSPAEVVPKSGDSRSPNNTDSYFLSIPHRTLKDAMDEAAASGKLVFAVIYDETNPTQSKLTYSLGYFMEYHTTKKLVHDYFIPAIIKASDAGASMLVPEDDPLELCLWVVLSSTGDILRREGVYANPDEGLKRVRSVISQYGIA